MKRVLEEENLKLKKLKRSLEEEKIERKNKQDKLKESSEFPEGFGASLNHEYSLQIDDSAQEVAYSL
jgi:hypothetical protein